MCLKDFMSSTLQLTALLFSLSLSVVSVFGCDDRASFENPTEELRNAATYGISYVKNSMDWMRLSSPQLDGEKALDTASAYRNRDGLYVLEAGSGTEGSIHVIADYTTAHVSIHAWETREGTRSTAIFKLVMTRQNNEWSVVFYDKSIVSEFDP